MIVQLIFFSLSKLDTYSMGLWKDQHTFQVPSFLRPCLSLPWKAGSTTVEIHFLTPSISINHFFQEALLSVLLPAPSPFKSPFCCPVSYSTTCISINLCHTASNQLYHKILEFKISVSWLQSGDCISELLGFFPNLLRVFK